jgi:oligopeptidase B
MAPQPPVAKRVPHRTERHGRTVEDDWAWLADRDDPDTLAYLEAENAYADAWFGQHGDLVEAIFSEIKARTQETDLSVPTRKGEWWYLTRTEEGRSYPIHVRRLDDADDAGELVLLDQNAEAEGHPYFSLGAFDVSPSGRLLAWSSDTSGDEVFTMRVRDLETGEDLSDALERTYYGSAWSLDEQHLFYVVPDDAMRPWQVWRHRLGTPQPDDELVLQEDDERFFVDLDLSRSEQFVIITSASRTTSEVHVIPAGAPLTPSRVIEPRRPDHEYAVDHQGDRFVVLTNDGAEDFKVVAAPVDDPSHSWTEVVAHVAGRRIDSLDAFDGFVVLREWFEAMPRIRIVFDDGRERVPAFDEAVHGVDLSSNPEYRTDRIRFELESLVTPRSVYEEAIDGHERVLLRQTPVLGGYDPGDYESVRTWATAPDGTAVPVDVVRKRTTPFDGTAPVVLYGYGAYEQSMAPWFSIARLSLLDRGIVWALAHPRGGGELGRRWYLEGKLLQKHRTFTDFAAAAEHLVEAGFAAADRVAIRGGSAGGLLVGAVVAQRPELPAAVVAEVPFVDVVTTMLDPSLPLTITEWEEWGDPREPEFERAMAAYAPYENVRAEAYPPMLVTAGLNDPRVAYHEPAKWVAKLRATTTGDQPLLLKTELSAGHAGPSGRYEAWREEARVLAFLVAVLGRG